jgi:hypothetical protein
LIASLDAGGSTLPATLGGAKGAKKGSRLSDVPEKLARVLLQCY